MDKFQNEVNIRIAFKGPLYNEAKESMSIVSLNLSSREKPSIKPVKQIIISQYADIPSFEVFAKGYGKKEWMG